VLLLQDALQPSGTLDAEVAARKPARAPVLAVHNKIDLLPDGARVPEGVLGVSAREGTGLDALRRELLRIAGWNPGGESPWLARERHVMALEEARAHLGEAAAHAAQDDRVLDLFAEELRLAHEALCGITGVFTSDDLLGEIFGRFCIGK